MSFEETGGYLRVSFRKNRESGWMGNGGVSARHQAFSRLRLGTSSDLTVVRNVSVLGFMFLRSHGMENAKLTRCVFNTPLRSTPTQDS